MKQLGFTDKKMLKMVQDKIDADEKKGLNLWVGMYTKDEQPPTNEKRIGGRGSKWYGKKRKILPITTTITT